MSFTHEQLAKAKAVKSVKELLAYANELNFKLTEDEAKFYFDQWHKEGELADNELSDVSGGSTCIDGKSYSDEPPYYLITTWGNTCPAYLFDEVMTAGVDDGSCFHCFYARKAGLIMYCQKRRANDDPYR